MAACPGASASAVKGLSPPSSCLTLAAPLRSGACEVCDRQASEAQQHLLPSRAEETNASCWAKALGRSTGSRAVNLGLLPFITSAASQRCMFVTSVKPHREGRNSSEGRTRRGLQAPAPGVLAGLPAALQQWRASRRDVNAKDALLHGRVERWPSACAEQGLDRSTQEAWCLQQGS